MKLVLEYFGESISVEYVENKETLLQADKELQRILSIIHGANPSASVNKKLIIAALNMTAKMIDKQNYIEVLEKKLSVLQRTIDLLISEDDPINENLL